MEHRLGVHPASSGVRLFLLVNAFARMWILRGIWNDVLWVNSRLTPAVRVAVLIFGIALIVLAWRLGYDWNWWTTPTTFVFSGMAREAPRWQFFAVHLGFVVLSYIGLSISRFRKTR